MYYDYGYKDTNMEILEFIEHELPRETQINIANIDHRLVPDLINPHPDAIKIMIKKNPYLFRKIKNPSKEMRYAAAETNIESICSMQNLSDDEKIFYYETYGPEVVGLLDNPPRKIQEETIKTGSISYISDLKTIDPDLQMEMVKEDYMSIVWITYPTLEAIVYSVHISPVLFSVIWNSVKGIYPIDLIPKKTLDKLINARVVKETEDGYVVNKRNDNF